MRSAILLSFVVTTALGAQAKPAAPPPKPGAPPPVPAAVPAAKAAPSTTVSGMVFDSLIDAPLHGATVILSGTAASAMTDTAGNYSMVVDSIPDGRYLLSFFHPTLDSIGIAAPPRTITVQHGTNVIADLAVPSAPSIIGAVCPDSLRFGGLGLLLGDVRDAQSDRPIPGVLVVVQWAAMSIGSSTLSRLPKALNARTDSDGTFRICGIPPRTPLRAQARLLPRMSGYIDLQFEPATLIVQQFLIGEQPSAAKPTVIGGMTVKGATPGGAAEHAISTMATATLVGSVVDGNNTPVEGAQVLLIGSTMTVSTRSDFRGNFRLPGLPVGTQTVEVRLISYQAKHYVVNLTPNKEAHLAAKLDQRAQVLDPVVVTAKESSPVPGFDERREHATGFFFNEQQIKDANTISVSDIFRRVPGLQVVFVNGQYQLTTSRGNTATCAEVQWYVDGMKYSSQGEDMDALFKPYELDAIEVYTSAVNTPVQFGGGQSACGTILLWTKRAHVKPKQAPAPKPTPTDSSGN